ncbi:MAG: phosphoglycerate kinase [Planctomycetota bacterium]|nr:phosphoglycerate kinase [Planctomycetota bacterium]
MRSLKDLDVKGRRVLVRLDLNVPLTVDGEIADDTRIRAGIPTVRSISERGGRVILLSHLGRPKGRPDPRLSLKPVAARLSEILERPVPLAAGIVGDDVRRAIEGMADGDCLLLENLRFNPGEKAGADEFIEELSSLGDLYINDAFGTCHRSDASVAGLPRRLPSAAGLLVEKELSTLERLLRDPSRPFVGVLGGAKITDKLPVVRNLLPISDRLLIGGGMAFTFLLARGDPIGASLADRELLDLARSLLKDGGDKILLPRDHLVRTKDGEVKVVEEVPEGAKAYDIGPATRESFAEALGSARTVVWNGPMGVFETEPFDQGTRAVADAIAGLDGALSVVGGGETIAAISDMGREQSFTHVSTGGGAFIEYVSGRTLPGVQALESGPTD